MYLVLSGMWFRKDKPFYVMMPYLKTYEPVTVRGITFWPGQELDDNEKLIEDDREHIRILLAQFYLRNDQRANGMLYTIIPANLDTSLIMTLLRRITEARILITYLYTGPHFPMGDTFLTFEHGDLFLFQTHRIFKKLAGIQRDAKNHPSIGDSEADGYQGLLNFGRPLWTVKDARIYPSVPAPTPNLSQDLHQTIGRLMREDYSWPLLRLISTSQTESEAFEKRAFQALEWYNRSSSSSIEEDQRIVNLAIAFETLLDLENSQQLRTFALCRKIGRDRGLLKNSSQEIIENSLADLIKG